MEEIAKYLKERIIHLHTNEVIYFNKMYEAANSSMRSLYREFANECGVRRQELQQMARDLNINI